MTELWLDLNTAREENGSMGADFYGYYVPYQEDKNKALQELRLREFEAGRYTAALIENDIYPEYGPDTSPFMDDVSDEPAPGKVHESIEDALNDEMAQEEGTGSILDLREVSDKKEMCVAHIPTKEDMLEYFGTDKPNRKQLEDGIWDYSDYLANLIGVRGIGFCITVFSDEQATELFFGGWSFD